VRATNEALRFLLEMSALVVLGLWGWQVGTTTISQVAFAIAAPAGAAMLWGTWVAPKSQRRLQDPARLAVELVVFGSEAAALVAMDQVGLAAILGLVVAVNLTLMFAWSQR